MTQYIKSCCLQNADQVYISKQVSLALETYKRWRECQVGCRLCLCVYPGIFNTALELGRQAIGLDFRIGGLGTCESPSPASQHDAIVQDLQAGAPGASCPEVLATSGSHRNMHASICMKKPTRMCISEPKLNMTQSFVAKFAPDDCW